MWIKSIHIYGFGKYQDFQASLQPGLNIIEGCNEAGKSTLLAFVRAILFGFENRRTPEARFEPLQGGKFGGALILDDGSGKEIRIERMGHRRSQGTVKVIFPNGEEKGEEALNSLWGGIGVSYYSNIQAFGLSELSYMNSLDQEEVAHYLYNSGTGISLQHLERSLGDDADKLFKPRGNQPEINRLLHEIEEASRQIKALQSENESYNRVLEEKIQIDEEISKVETAVNEHRSHLKKWEKAKELYPVWQELQIKAQLLEELPDIPAFPEQGISRLEHLEEQIRECEVAQEEIAQYLALCRERTESLRVDDKWLQAEDQLEQLTRQAVKWEDRQMQIAVIRAEYDQLERELQRYLLQLGTTWDKEFLANYDISLSRKEMIREHRQFLQELASSRNTLEQLIITKNDEKEDIELQLQRMQGELRPGERLEDIHAVEDQFQIYRNLCHEMGVYEREKARIQEKLAASASKGKKSTGVNPTKTAFFILTAGLLVSLLIAYWVPNIWIPAFLAGVTLIAAAVLWKIGKQDRHRGDDWTELLRQWQEELQQIEQSIGEQKRKINQITQEYFKGEAAPEKIKSWIKHLQDRKISEIQQTEKRAWLKEKLNHLDREIEKLEYKHLSLLNKYEEGMEKWADMLSAYRLPSGLSPDGVLELFGLAEKAKECLEALMDLHKKQLTMEKQFDSFAYEVTQLAKKLQPHADIDEPSSILYALKQKCIEAKRQLNELQEWQAKRTEAEQEMEKKSRLLKKLHDEQERLFKAAQVSHGEDFRRRHALFLQRKKVKEEWTLLNQAVSRANLGAEVIPLFQTYAQDDMENQLEKSVQVIHEQQKILESLLDKRGRLWNRMEQLESGQGLFMLSQHRQELLAQLEKSAVHWTALRMAGIVLQRIRQTYESERQPGVLKQAAHYFHLMTNGKYTRIISPIGEQKLIVERADGMRLEPGFLSRGTREQLFLCLRLALVRECGGDEQLPIILDDIFVNFDQARTSAAIRTLETISQQSQVLFFTCHAHVSTMMKQYIRNAHSISLDHPVHIVS